MASITTTTSNKRMLGAGGTSDHGSSFLLGSIDENAAVSITTGMKLPTATNISLDNIDWHSNESLEVFLKDLENATNARISKDIDEVEKQATMQIDTIVSSYLMKLTKSTKQMTCQKFQETHGFDLVGMCQQMIDNLDTYSVDANATTTSIRRNNETDEYGRPLRTPARMATLGSASLSATLGRTPATVVRRPPQHGEIMYSAKGSPIGVGGISDAAATTTTVAAAAATAAGPNEDDDDTTMMVSVKKPMGGDGSKVPSLEINLGGGLKVDVRDPSSLQNMDAETTLKMKQHLEVFQDEISTFLGQLGLNSSRKQPANAE